MRIRYSIIFYWLPFGIIATILCGLVYVALQQEIRQTANDPQIGMAQDIAIALSNGATPQSLTSGMKIEMSKSLSPFVIVYDSSGKVLAASGMLKGEVPM